MADIYISECKSYDTIDDCIYGDNCGWCFNNTTIGKCVQVMCGPNSEDYSINITANCSIDLAVNRYRINELCSSDLTLAYLLTISTGFFCTSFGLMLIFYGFSNDNKIHGEKLLISIGLGIGSAVFCGMAVENESIQNLVSIINLVILAFGIVMGIMKCVLKKSYDGLRELRVPLNP